MRTLLNYMYIQTLHISNISILQEDYSPLYIHMHFYIIIFLAALACLALQLVTEQSKRKFYFKCIKMILLN